MNEIKLKRCPFCGGEVRIMSYSGNVGSPICINYEDELEEKLSFVHCYNCDMDCFTHGETARDVLKSWNTRKPMQEIVERLEESKQGAKDSKDLSKYSAYEQAIGIVKGVIYEND